MSRALLEGPPEIRIAAIAALVRRGEPPTEDELAALGECLGDERKALQRRAAEAFASLAGRGMDVAERVRTGLRASDLRRRWGAVYALSLIGQLPLETLPTLLEVLASDDGDLRWAAAHLLERLAASDRQTVVSRLLAAAEVPGPARKMALYCLRDLGVAEAANAAVAALADRHVDTRLAALAVIAKVHADPAAAARIIAVLLDDPEPRMQRAAAGTLGQLGVATDEVMNALGRVSTATDSSLARAAKRARQALERK